MHRTQEHPERIDSETSGIGFGHRLLRIEGERGVPKSPFWPPRPQESLPRLVRPPSSFPSFSCFVVVVVFVVVFLRVHR